MRHERRKRCARRCDAILGTSNEREVRDCGTLSHARGGTLDGGEELPLHAFGKVDSRFALGLRCRVLRGSVPVAYTEVAEELVEGCS
jgi:hypothetical protein